MEGMYLTDTERLAAERALEVVEAGTRALKFMPVPRTLPVEGAENVRRAERLVAAVREAVGPGVDLMVDLHGRCLPGMAKQYCRAFADYGLLWVEEPCQTTDLEATAEVRRASPVPIATGERLVGLSQFRELFERRAADIVQPDLSHCGGLWEARKIAALAEAHSLAVAPHNPNGPIATAAAIHFALATPNWVIQEAISSDVPWRRDVLDEPFAVVEGEIAPPDRPGLGVEVDEEAAAAYPYAEEAEQRLFHPDGAVAEW
jgi:galactonate dehydratase